MTSSGVAFPQIDRDQIHRFVQALFCHAKSGYVQLRAFRDDVDGTWRPADWPAVSVETGLAELVDKAERWASECAAAPVPVVFAPPVATLKDPIKAAEKDIASGPALSVDCDERPIEARNRLVAILGPPTLTIATGGEWVDPPTGEIQPKQHLHWRLAKPTGQFSEHVALKEARREAMLLIGADPSGVPLVHPLRWPGSWHRKGKPRLTTIIECNPEIEIDLTEAFAKLRKARANGADHKNNYRSEDSAGTGAHDETSVLIAKILRAEDYHDPIAKLAMRYLMGGMPDAQAVETLRGIMLAVDPGRRDLKGGALHKDRWRSRYDDIPRAVGTARAKIDEQPNRSQSQSNDPDWPEPSPLLAQKLEAAPSFPVNFLPGPLADLACDITDRMQCPVDIVAIPLIIGAATAIGKGFRLAPKAHDDWTERPCLWGGIILSSGQMKTPALQKGLRPIRWLESEFHKRHEKEIEEYNENLTRAEYAERCWKEACKRASKAGNEMPQKPPGAEAPVPPRLRRLTTSDATQESLVDLIEQNPQGLLLFRDELSGWFASFNQYRPGSDRQFYLECHAGGAFPKDRRVGSVLIKDLYLNICGGLQPEIVRQVLAGGDRDGMAARFSLLVWPDRFEGFTYIDRQPNAHAEHKTEGVIKRLFELDPEAFFGPDKPGTALAFRFDDEAQSIFVDWYTKNQLRLRHNEEPRGFNAHLSKYAGLFARLAIVHHLIRHVLDETASPVLVDAHTASAVETFIDDYLEHHARRIYQHLGGNQIRDGARRIAQWIVETPDLTQFTAREVRRNEWSGLAGQDEVNLALDFLENVAGWIRCTTNLPGPKGGRPSSQYLINPRVRW
jgi:Protein of unknown function (DUF3987)